MLSYANRNAAEWVRYLSFRKSARKPTMLFLICELFNYYYISYLPDYMKSKISKRAND